MRERLTLAFVCLALVIAGVVGTARATALGDVVRVAQLDRLTSTAKVIASLVEDLESNDVAVTSEQLATFVPKRTELTLERPESEILTLSGVGFDPDVGDDAPRVRETVGSTTVALVQDEEVVLDQTLRQERQLLALMLVAVILASLLGFVLASALARPFQELARSAAALGRGRYDIEPPTSRIREVASIAASLKAGATQLQDSMRRDREFVLHTSHVLRTPLTGMRLELEELSLRSDLDDEVRRTLTRCLADVQRLDKTVGDLLDLARGRQVVAGAEVTLVMLGSQVAQRWRDRLPESREVRAFVDGGPDVTVTPGPIEQLLDSVLLDVSVSDSGPVTLRFAGLEEHIRVLIQTGTGDTGAGAWTDSQSARRHVEVLGGRCSGDAAKGELEILLPRR